MLSYQVTEHGKPLQQVFTQAPKPKGTEVLVRITRSGVCHSDLHIWDCLLYTSPSPRDS